MQLNCKHCNEKLSIYFQDNLCVICFLEFCYYMEHKQYTNTDVPTFAQYEYMHMTVIRHKFMKGLLIDWKVDEVNIMWDEFAELRA